LRVGLIGCGNVALHHARTYLAYPERFRVVGAADLIPERRALCRDVFDLVPVDIYADAAAVVARPDVELVDVCTPPHTRRDIVEAAAAAGKHILCEKPLATVPADAAAMVAATRRAGVVLGVVHNYYFFPEIATAVQLLRGGAVGQVDVAILNYLGVVDLPGNAAYRATWRHELAISGGGVLMDMLHSVYVAEALLDRAIERVSGYVDARDPGAPVESLALCRFETGSNAALVNVGWGVGPGGIEVSGSTGRLALRYRDGATSPFAPFEEMVLHNTTGCRKISVSAEARDPFAALALDYADAVVDGRDPIAPGEQGLHVLEATLAVYESCALGRVVTLPLDHGDPVYRHGVAGLREMELPYWSPVRRRRLFAATTGTPGGA
jgi:predicted dehydrogenase